MMPSDVRKQGTNETNNCSFCCRTDAARNTLETTVSFIIYNSVRRMTTAGAVMSAESGLNAGWWKKKKEGDTTSGTVAQTNKWTDEYFTQPRSLIRSP